MKDCVQQGYVLDGFPKTKNQALLLTQSKIIPDFVFSLLINENEVFDRIKKAKKEKFGYDMQIVNDRINNIEKELGSLESYYIDTFDNLRYISTQISKWGMYDQARKLIIDQREKKYKLGISLITGSPCIVSTLGFITKDILQSIADISNYSSVALRTKVRIITY